MMLGIVSMVAFNLIDTYYVGKLGADELAALSFTFPVIMVIFSLVQGIGIGATALISKSIGAGNLPKAQRETSDSLVLGLILAGVVSVIGLATIDPVFKLLGADEFVLPHIRSYMSVWYITIIFVVVPFVGNSAIRASGDAKTPAYIMLFAVFINAVLDPLLIFGIGPFPELGLKGAALATACSRALTLVLSLYVLYFRQRLITLEIPSFSVLRGCWRSILEIGVPSGISKMLTPVAIGMITALIATYGKEAVAAFGVASRIEFLTMSILFALAASFGPFTGQNIGAGNYSRVVSALKKGTGFSIAWGFTMAILLFFTGKQISMIFNEHENVIMYSAAYLSIVPFGFGFQGVTQTCNAVLNTINKPLQASLVILLIMFGLMVPLAHFGSQQFGVDGIFYGMAITYTIGGIGSYLLTRKWLKNEASKAL